MSNKKQLPRFLIADNPMVGEECYIVVTGKVRAIVRTSDYTVVEGHADNGLILRLMQWHKAYNKYINR